MRDGRRDVRREEEIFFQLTSYSFCIHRLFRVEDIFLLEEIVWD